MSVQRIPPPMHMASTANVDPDRVNTATSETLDWPGATFAAGDVGIILASSGGTEVTVSGGGGGWSEVAREVVVGANAHACFAFACRVDQATLDANGGVMPAPTVSVAAGGFPIVLAYMFHLRGARGTTVADCVRTWSATQASGTAISFGSVDLLADSYCLFLYGAGTNGQQLGSVASSMAGFYNPLHLFSHAVATGDDANINISRAIFIGPGATGSTSGHTASANTQRAKILVAIAPPQEADLVIPPDETAPTITNIDPAPGSPLREDTVISLDVDDESELSVVAILATIRDEDGVIIAQDVVHDGFAFGFLYAGEANDRVSTATGYSFTILRDGGWPGAPTFDYVVRDAGGNAAVIA